LRNKVPKRGPNGKRKANKDSVKKQLTSDELLLKKKPNVRRANCDERERMKKFFQQTNIKNGMK
jgi:hypothetical protein